LLAAGTIVGLSCAIIAGLFLVQRWDAPPLCTACNWTAILRYTSLALLLTVVHILTIAEALLSGATRFGAAKLGFAFSPIVLTYLLFNTVVGIYNIAHWSSFSILKARMLERNKWAALGSVVAPLQEQRPE
jgi:K+ potassium transporter